MCKLICIDFIEYNNWIDEKMKNYYIKIDNNNINKNTNNNMTDGTNININNNNNKNDTILNNIIDYYIIMLYLDDLIFHGYIIEVIDILCSLLAIDKIFGNIPYTNISHNICIDFHNINKIDLPKDLIWAILLLLLITGTLNIHILLNLYIM